MSVGILQKEKKTVVEIKESGNSVTVEKSYIAEDIVNCRHAVVGLPLDNFIIKNLYLPNVSKKELQKTIELQLEFNIPNHQEEYDTSYIVKEYSTGYLLMILAAKKSEKFGKAMAIVPAPLGLYSFAVHQKLIDKKTNTLLIYVNDNNVTSLTLEGNKPVFMREYPSETAKATKQRIQLSSQAVFLQAVRHFIDIDKIVVFSTSESYSNLIVEAVGKENEVQWFDSSEYDNKEVGNMLLHVGLALFHKQAKTMSDWSVSDKPPGTRESIKRILIFTIPLLIIFLPLYNYAEYYAKNSKIKSIQTELDQFSIQLGDVDKLGYKVSREKAYMDTIGNPSLNFARINKLFNVINMCRSDNLWLTSLSGKVDGLIVINGFAQSYSNITNFIKNLETFMFIKDINLNYSNETSGQSVSFQMTFRLAEGYSFILDSNSKTKSEVNKINKNETEETPAVNEGSKLLKPGSGNSGQGQIQNKQKLDFTDKKELKK